MRSILAAVFSFAVSASATGQNVAKTTWYSEMNSNGIVIQNSFPKGGPYRGMTIKNFNYSQLVFFTRIVNETDTPFELTINFSGDSIPVPNAPDTYVRVFLPSETMTFEKQPLYNYGLTDSEAFDRPTTFQRTLKPKEECLFYVAAVFYQTTPTADNRYRGGNRAELVLKGQDLFYNMLPQIDSLPCGRIVFKK